MNFEGKGSKDIFFHIQNLIFWEFIVCHLFNEAFEGDCFNIFVFGSDEDANYSNEMEVWVGEGNSFLLFSKEVPVH